MKYAYQDYPDVQSLLDASDEERRLVFEILQADIKLYPWDKGVMVKWASNVYVPAMAELLRRSEVAADASKRVSQMYDSVLDREAHPDGYVHPMIGRPTSSAAHSLFSQKSVLHYRCGPDVGRADEVSDGPPPPVQAIFLLQHDWTLVAPPDGDRPPAPFDSYAVEMDLEGCRVLVRVDGVRNKYLFFIKGETEWVMVTPEPNDQFQLWSWQHILAMLKMLDADVAEPELIPAPVALNKQRAKKGKGPLLDYHVINLAKRHRSRSQNSESTGRRVRLHFRRGHWYHPDAKNRPDWKVWRKWTLVGDPDLGWVDHLYKA